MADQRVECLQVFEVGPAPRSVLASDEPRVVWRGGMDPRHLVPDEERRRLYASDMVRSEIFAMSLDTDEPGPEWGSAGTSRDRSTPASHPDGWEALEP